MDWSVRNKIVFTSHGILLYVGNSCSLLKLNFKQFSTLLLFRVFKNKKFFSRNDFALLKKTGALLECKESDFLNSTIMLENCYRAAYRVFDVTICISEGCNFKCRYCYEKAFEKESVISYEVINQFVQYLKLQQENFSALNVTIYGGEPLLSLKRILYLHEKLSELHKKITYSMITNGYLLSLDVYKILMELPVNHFQVTIDGFKENHNKNRPHKRNNDSFDRIIKNLDDIYDFCISNNKKSNISIRVNIDKLNCNKFVDFYGYLNGKYNGFFRVNSAFIEGKCDKTVLSKRQRIKFCLNNFSHKIFESRYLPHISSRMNYCCATLHKSAVVDTAGNVFKCWNDIGNKDKIIFNLNKPEQKDILQEAKYYTQSDPFYDKKCVNCFLLFSCYGGCPQKNADNKNRDCDLAKYKPTKFLEALYLRRLCYEN